MNYWFTDFIKKGPYRMKKVYLSVLATLAIVGVGCGDPAILTKDQHIAALSDHAGRLMSSSLKLAENFSPAVQLPVKDIQKGQQKVLSEFKTALGKCDSNDLDVVDDALVRGETFMNEFAQRMKSRQNPNAEAAAQSIIQEMVKKYQPSWAAFVPKFMGTSVACKSSLQNLMTDMQNAGLPIPGFAVPAQAETPEHTHAHDHDHGDCDHDHHHDGVPVPLTGGKVEPTDLGNSHDHDHGDHDHHHDGVPVPSAGGKVEPTVLGNSHDHDHGDHDHKDVAADTAPQTKLEISEPELSRDQATLDSKAQEKGEVSENELPRPTDLGAAGPGQALITILEQKRESDLLSGEMKRHGFSPKNMNQTVKP